jgi:hypothetical protein
MSPAPAAAPSPADIAYLFLQHARDTNEAVQNGTVAVSNAGGASATVSWDVPVQDFSAWATEIDLQITLPITVVIPAAGSVTVSPFAPYSALQLQLLIGGAESIPPMSLVPFWLDEITSRQGFDPFDYGPENGGGFGPAIPSAWENPGPPAAGVPATTLNGLVPGNTITNGGGSTATTNYTLVFRSRIKLARSLYGRIQENLAGAVPMGDPSARPDLKMRLNGLIGTQPENALFVNASTGVTATTSATVQPTVTAVWKAKTLDELPTGLVVPTPPVIMALEVDTNSGQAVPNSGQFSVQQLRTAMLYHKIFHVVVNGEMPIDGDYFGMWYSASRSTARMEYDGNENTFWRYYQEVHSVYGRYLPLGVFVADLVGGELPELPKETPYEGVVTPSVSLAQSMGLKPYPALQSVLRILQGTAISGAYVTTYAFGMIPVNY